jgi:hypothetical protein
MDQPNLENRIRQAKVTVALAREQIAHQRVLISTLEKRGDRAASAGWSLRIFEAKERTDTAELKRLVAELATAGDRHIGFWRRLTLGGSRPSR